MNDFNENYNIDIANNNVLYPNFLSVGVIKVLLYEDFHDTGIDRYYFNTKLVSEKNKNDINWKINYLLFDLYNSFCYLTNKTVLITHDRNNPILSITEYLNTIDLIVNGLRNNLNLINDLYADDSLKKCLSLVSQSKIMLETTLSFASMLKKDENFLLHAYKIQDTAKSLMKVLEKDLRFKDKQIVKNLDATLNKIPRKFGLISNNASLSGLASRHGHTARKTSNNIPDLKDLVDESLTIFGEVLYIVYEIHFILNNSPENLDEDENHYKFELIIDDLI